MFYVSFNNLFQRLSTNLLENVTDLNWYTVCTYITSVKLSLFMYLIMYFMHLARNTASSKNCNVLYDSAVVYIVKKMNNESNNMRNKFWEMCSINFWTVQSDPRFRCSQVVCRWNPLVLHFFFIFWLIHSMPSCKHIFRIFWKGLSILKPLPIIRLN